MNIAYQFRCDRILMALKELELWEKRRDNLAKNLLILNNFKKASKAKELEKINRQINYYDSLTKDMKKEFKPARLSDFLSSF
ncbi:MAG: hypothetical protein ACFFG0_44380 [Candidatus Thorarchaeota archaeon]